MSQKCFNDVALLNTHKSRTDNLRLVDVANEFIARNETGKETLVLSQCKIFYHDQWDFTEFWFLRYLLLTSKPSEDGRSAYEAASLMPREVLQLDRAVNSVM